MGVVVVFIPFPSKINIYEKKHNKQVAAKSDCALLELLLYSQHDIKKVKNLGDLKGNNIHIFPCIFHSNINKAL